MAKQAMIQATQVLIAFQVEGDREAELISLLNTLTQIALFLWGLWVRVCRLRREAQALQRDIQEAARVAFAEIGKLWSFEISFTVGTG